MDETRGGKVTRTEGEWPEQPLGVEGRSSLFRSDRVFDMDRIEEAPQGLQPLWDPRERPLDPMAYRVRETLKHLKPEHAKALEDHFFLGLSFSEMAAEKGCTKSSMFETFTRALRNFKAAVARHGHELTVVPPEEM